jgi:hypothetical protein
VPVSYLDKASIVTERYLSRPRISPLSCLSSRRPPSYSLMYILFTIVGERHLTFRMTATADHTYLLRIYRTDTHQSGSMYSEFDSACLRSALLWNSVLRLLNRSEARRSIIGFYLLLSCTLHKGEKGDKCLASLAIFEPHLTYWMVLLTFLSHS